MKSTLLNLIFLCKPIYGIGVEHKPAMVMSNHMTPHRERFFSVAMFKDFFLLLNLLFQVLLFWGAHNSVFQVEIQLK